MFISQQKFCLNLLWLPKPSFALPDKEQFRILLVGMNCLLRTKDLRSRLGNQYVVSRPAEKFSTMLLWLWVTTNCPRNRRRRNKGWVCVWHSPKQGRSAKDFPS